MRATADDVRYVRCEGCGLLWQSPPPREEEVGGLYPDDYVPHAGGAGGIDREKLVNRLAIRFYHGVERRTDAPLRRAFFRLLSPWVLHGLHAPHGANRLLDVGCGGGSLLGKYRDLGWSVRGVEISPRAVATARGRGLDVHQGTVFDAPFAPGAFDLVVLSHVIEHVLDPLAFLRRCTEFLAPGGRLVCLTPNARSLGLALFGSCWFSLDAPRHLALFDPRTIRALGAKAGLVPRRVSTTADVRQLCQSRHYLRTQGRKLPDSLAEREALIDRSPPTGREYPVYRACMRPVAVLASLLGRGETLEAEFAIPASRPVRRESGRAAPPEGESGPDVGSPFRSQFTMTSTSSVRTPVSRSTSSTTPTPGA